MRSAGAVLTKPARRSAAGRCTYPAYAKVSRIDLIHSSTELRSHVHCLQQRVQVASGTSARRAAFSASKLQLVFAVCTFWSTYWLSNPTKPYFPRSCGGKSRPCTRCIVRLPEANARAATTPTSWKPRHGQPCNSQFPWQHSLRLLHLHLQTRRHRPQTGRRKGLPSLLWAKHLRGLSQRAFPGRAGRVEHKTAHICAYNQRCLVFR